MTRLATRRRKYGFRRESPTNVMASAPTLLDERITVADFRFVRRENRVQIPNAPSPAATASLAIAEPVARLARMIPFPSWRRTPGLGRSSRLGAIAGARRRRVPPRSKT